MKDKAPLPIMEQLVMILVFALAATICVQGFVLANRISLRQEARAHVVVSAQNTAELLKQTAGDYEAAAQIMGGTWDGQFLTVSLGGSRILQATPTNSSPALLGSSQIQVLDDGDVLFEIVVAWQEVTTNVFP